MQGEIGNKEARRSQKRVNHPEVGSSGGGGCGSVFGTMHWQWRAPTYCRHNPINARLARLFPLKHLPGTASRERSRGKLKNKTYGYESTIGVSSIA